MEEIADITALFDLPRGGEAISQVERLLNYFESHEAKEEKSLERYTGIVGEIKDPAIRFLLQLIASDEENHRRITEAMALTLRGSLNWTKPPGSLEANGDQGKDTERLLAITEGFIDLEKEGIREYKILLKESVDYYRGLFTILLQSMIRDSEKHVELLEFLRERLKAQ